MKEKLQSTKPKTRLSQKQKPEMPGRFVQTKVKRIDVSTADERQHSTDRLRSLYMGLGMEMPE